MPARRMLDAPLSKRLVDLLAENFSKTFDLNKPIKTRVKNPTNLFFLEPFEARIHNFQSFSKANLFSFYQRSYLIVAVFLTVF